MLFWFDGKEKSNNPQTKITCFNNDFFFRSGMGSNSF